MKPFIAILVLIASALMLVNVFAKPLGIPSEFEKFLLLGVGVCFVLLFTIQKKAKAAGQVRAPSEATKTKYFWLLLVVTVCTCISGPCVLPFTGVRLPFWELVVVSSVTFVITTGILWCGLMMKKQ